MLGQTQKHPEWRVIVDMFRAIDYGAVLAHDTIATATGLRAETVPYYRHVATARRALLRDHAIEVESVPKVGYRRVEPERYGERGRHYVRLGSRRIARGKRVVESAPLHMLTTDQVKELEHTMKLLQALRTHTGKVIRSMRNVLPPVTAQRALPATLPESTETH